MPRPTRERSAALALGQELGRWNQSPGYSSELLVRCANDAIETWRDDVAGFTKAFGEPVTDDAMREIQEHLRRDLTEIAPPTRRRMRRAAGAPGGSLPRRATVLWWYDSRGRKPSLMMQAADVSLNEFFDWSVMVLWLRDADRLKCCPDCHRFWLASTARHRRCPSRDCAAKRRATSIADAKAKYGKANSVTEARSKGLVPKRTRAKVERAARKIIEDLGR